MKRYVLWLLLVMMLPCSALAENSSAVVKITDPDMAHELFAKALKEKNLEQLCSMYADDAVMVLKDGSLTVEGKYSIKRVFSWMLDAVEELDIETLYKVEANDTVLFRSKYHSVFVTPSGERTDMVSSGIVVLKKQADGSWLFVIDHQNGGTNVL